MKYLAPKPQDYGMENDVAAGVAFLEWFQEQQYAQINEPLPQGEYDEQTLTDALSDQLGLRDKDDVRSTIRLALEAGRSIIGSRYDDALFKQHMHRTSQELGQFIAATGWKQPIHGMSPLLSSNACVINHTSSGQHIVILQRGLLRFFLGSIFELLKACPVSKNFREWTDDELIFPSEADGALDAVRRTTPGLMVAILSTMNGWSKDLSAKVMGEVLEQVEPGSVMEGAALDTELAQPLRFMGASIYDCLTAFVLGHEYSHILAPMGLKVWQSWGSFPGMPDAECAEMLASYSEEQFADDLGAKLSLARNAKANYGPECAYLGISLFFDLSILLDRCIKMLMQGTVDDADEINSHTHPPLTLRRKMIETSIAAISGDPLDAARGQTLAASFSQVLELVWRVNRPLFELWHRRDLKSHLLAEYQFAPKIAPNIYLKFRKLGDGGEDDAGA